MHIIQLFFSLIIILFLSIDVKAQTKSNEVYVINTIMPFPGTPERSEMDHMGALLTLFVYESKSSHIKYLAQVAENLPDVENPPATMLRGFTRGHEIQEQREFEVNGLNGIIASSITGSSRQLIWHIFAFEHKEAVYMWIQTYEHRSENGSEYEEFLSNLKKIRIR